MSFVVDYEKPIFNGCTPPSRLLGRYLRWNSHGIVAQFAERLEEEEDSASEAESFGSINVRFHEISIHRELEFDNHQRFTMADLSRRALVLASAKRLHCQRFGKLEPNEPDEWQLELTRGEHGRALALGEEFVALATDRRTVRICSMNGTQFPPLSTAGPVVAMAASGDTLAVVCRSQLPLPEEQSLEVMLIEVNPVHGLPIRQLPFSPVKLPVGRGAELRWVGFTDEGSLASYDSDGRLRLLKNGYGCGWVQVAEMHKEVCLSLNMLLDV